MNITDQQLKEIALAGGVMNVDELTVKRSDNHFQLINPNDSNTVFSLKFIIGPCVDKVEFKSNLSNFDEDASRRKMESLNLIERL